MKVTNRIFWAFLISGLFMSFTKDIQAQDPILTQSQMVPLYYNPAFTGAFDGTYRVGLHYRDQWRRFLDEPINTWSVYGDFSFPAPFQDLGQGDRIGAGIQFNADRVGPFDFNTNQISLNLAYHLALDNKKKESLSLGMSIGVLQRSINYSLLTFGDEFNGIDDYTQSTGEPLPPNILAVADLGIGLRYAVKASPNAQFFAGLAMLHMTQPNISYYEQDNLLEPRYSSDYDLPARFDIQAGIRTDITKITSLTPRIHAIIQGPFQFYQLGATVRSEIIRSEASAFHAGAWINAHQEVSGFDLQGATLMAGMEVRNLLIGLSYDILADNLNSNVRWRNSFEFSIRFIGQAENTDYFCPEF